MNPAVVVIDELAGDIILKGWLNQFLIFYRNSKSIEYAPEVT